MKKVENISSLVTGASGFLGTTLVKALLDRGFTVRGCARTPLVVKHPNFRFINIPVLDGSTHWVAHLSGVDTVFHLAAVVHRERLSKADLQLQRLVNVEATIRLARQCAQAGVRRFIFVSSIKVLGEETAIGKPFNEKSPFAPLDHYARTKMDAELALREIMHTSGLEVVIVRPPLVYGRGVRGNMRRIAWLVSLGIPLPFGGITTNLRSFVSSQNLVDFLITCMNDPRARNQTLLVSDGNDFSTVELLRLISSGMKKPLRLIPLSVKYLMLFGVVFGKREAVRRLSSSLQVDSRYTEILLQWRPSTPPEVAISEMLSEFH